LRFAAGDPSDGVEGRQVRRQQHATIAYDDPDRRSAQEFSGGHVSRLVSKIFHERLLVAAPSERSLRIRVLTERQKSPAFFIQNPRQYFFGSVACLFFTFF
jgi:hypothetical protein